MNYCTKCGKPTDNGMICEDCIVNNSPWLLAMKIKENDLEQEIEQLKAKNAELRARLDKLEAQITYEIVYDGMIDKFFVIKCIKKEYECVGNFDNEQEAEKKLAELKGEK